MPYPESVDDPRDDVRPPTFYKGQWFGAVPRTRIYISLGSASGKYSFMVGGVVLQADFFPTDPQPPGQGIWFGTYTDGDDTFALTYESSVVLSPSGIGFGQFTLEHPIPPTGTAIWRLSGDNWLPGANHAMPLLLNQLPATFSDTASAVWVPDWARPSERWPNATITEPL